MARAIIWLSAVGVLTACGQSTQPANEADTKTVQPETKLPAHCFFKDSETKDWSASRGKDGNIVVKGKAYRSDSRYQALFGPPTITGTTVEIAPTIQQNSTGYGAPDNWWPITATIPNSAAVNTVRVKCGAKTLTELKVATKG